MLYSQRPTPQPTELSTGAVPTVPVFHPTSSPLHPTIELVMTLTTSSPVTLPFSHQQTVDVATYNTLQSLSLFQRSFRFKAIVFTDSPAIRSTAERLHLLWLPIVHANPYGLPLVREMLLAARNHFNTSFYGYMNSDILLNPGVFGFVHASAEAIRNHRLQRAVVHKECLTDRWRWQSASSIHMSTSIRLTTLRSRSTSDRFRKSSRRVDVVVSRRL